MLWLLQTVKNETIWIEKAIVFHIVRKPTMASSSVLYGGGRAAAG